MTDLLRRALLSRGPRLRAEGEDEQRQEWTGEFRIDRGLLHVCATHDRPLLLPFSHARPDYVVLRDAHLDEITFSSGLHASFFEGIVREVRRERVAVARKRKELQEAIEAAQQLMAELRRTQTMLQTAGVEPGVVEGVEAATEEELHLAVQAAVGVAQRVFGDDRVQGAEQEEEQDPDSPASHRVSVVVLLDEDFEPDVVATQEREFYTGSVDALPDSLLTRVQFVLKYVS